MAGYTLITKGGFLCQENLLMHTNMRMDGKIMRGIYVKAFLLTDIYNRAQIIQHKIVSQQVDDINYCLPLQLQR